jgi:hypothetical protein
VAASVVITGSGYPADFVAGGGTVSFGAGITVGTVTRNTASKLTVDLVVDPAATLGSRDIIVTNPDGGRIACSGCFSVNPQPTVSPPLLPSSVPRGASQKQIAVTGSGFQSGAGATASGTGVTVNSVTFNNAGSLTLRVSVAGTAALGARDVVFTNRDGGSVTCVGCLTVSAVPTISTVTPNNGARGASHLIVNVAGTGYQPGAQVTLSGAGVTVHGTTFGNAGSLTVDLSILGTAATGNRSVTVTNPDGGTVTKANAFKVN